MNVDRLVGAKVFEVRHRIDCLWFERLCAGARHHRWIGDTPEF